MAINLKKLDKRTYTFTFRYGDQEMEVEYRPADITKSEYIERVNQIEDVNENLLHQMRTAIVHWELVDEDGKELEPTLELIEAVERPFWFALGQAINDDLERRYKEKKGSNGA